MSRRTPPVITAETTRKHTPGPGWRVLQNLIAQATAPKHPAHGRLDDPRYVSRKTDAKKIREDFELTRTKIADELGISRRSLNRYLEGERQAPEGVALRLDAYLDRQMYLIRQQRQEDAADDEVPYLAPKQFPVHVERYKRPRSLLGPSEEASRSEIIEVNTQGFSNAEVAAILKGYWEYFRKNRLRSYIRFLVNVPIAQYFTGGIHDKPLRQRVIKDRLTHIPMLLPPQRLYFTTKLKRDDYDLWLEYANDELSEYRVRLADDFNFLGFSIIPIKDYDASIARRKRKRGK